MIKSICTLLFSILIAYQTNAQIQLLNDEFDNSATLSANWLNINDEEGWNAEHLEVHDINTSTAGSLHMMPYTSSWYQDYRGTLLFKNIDQNFVLTTEVTVSNRAGNGLPSSQFSLAGLMIRNAIDYPNGATSDWQSGNENYIFMAAGRANAGTPQFEVKTTVNGNSSLQISNISTTSNVQIRIARIDAAIIVLYRLPNQNWEVHQRYARPDFDNEIQMGFVTYTDWPKVSSYAPIFHNSNVLNSSLSPDPSQGVPFTPDIIGQFDFARFDDITVPTSLAGVDLVSSATDTDLLSFLGFESAAFCPVNIHVSDVIEPSQITHVSASQDVTANNFINVLAEVDYVAENSVELQSGFEVLLGATFTAEIGPCN